MSPTNQCKSIFGEHQKFPKPDISGGPQMYLNIWGAPNISLTLYIGWPTNIFQYLERIEKYPLDVCWPKSTSTQCLVALTETLERKLLKQYDYQDDEKPHLPTDDLKLTDKQAHVASHVRSRRSSSQVSFPVSWIPVSYLIAFWPPLVATWAKNLFSKSNRVAW